MDAYLYSSSLECRPIQTYLRAQLSASKASCTWLASYSLQYDWIDPVAAHPYVIFAVTRAS